MPWRQPETDGSFDPYKILVSEIMLQQTQVSRVLSKYEQFLTAFPHMRDLANATQAEVLTLWNGLGYNRRARFLHQSAIMVAAQGYALPRQAAELTKLPGIGPNTAAAIRAYAFNEPVVFIETNIRSVFIHNFFADDLSVTDARLYPLIEQTLDDQNPRQWYWALMDYGSYLKSKLQNPSRRSARYQKQAPFMGSRRQLRGQIIRLLSRQPMQREQLQSACRDERLNRVLNELCQEKLINYHRRQYYL